MTAWLGRKRLIASLIGVRFIPTDHGICGATSEITKFVTWAETIKIKMRIIMDYLPSEIKIKLLDDEKWKAIVTLKFDKITIRGFRISVSKVSNEFWVIPPSFQNGKTKQYHPIFFIDDKELWKTITQMILDEYDKSVATNS